MARTLKTTSSRSPCAGRRYPQATIFQQTFVSLVNAQRPISLSLLPKKIVIARCQACPFTGLNAWELSCQLYLTAAVHSQSSGQSGSLGASCPGQPRDLPSRDLLIICSTGRNGITTSALARSSPRDGGWNVPNTLGSTA